MTFKSLLQSTLCNSNLFFCDFCMRILSEAASVCKNMQFQGTTRLKNRVYLPAYWAESVCICFMAGFTQAFLKIIIQLRMTSEAILKIFLGWRSATRKKGLPLQSARLQVCNPDEFHWQSPENHRNFRILKVSKGIFDCYDYLSYFTRSL